MGQALYRKYRPKKLADIVGEEHITSSLSNALAKNQISHAYLFTGPRGVGKTSVARILAHEINGFKYDDDQDYLDIIEIDAASNRRIDEIRQLRDRVNISPSQGKYKVYIIDEVHMLTREAFNALLKTLEEPPSHAIFILATTEAHKVPETIVSRTQQYSFRPYSTQQIKGQLKYIAKEEKIKIDDKALDIIADYGQGSFRDSISLLDQASSISDNVTEKELLSLLGMAPSTLIDKILDSLEQGSIENLAETLKIIDQEGYNVSVVCKQLIDRLKTDLSKNNLKLDANDALKIMKSLVDVPASSDSSTMLEVVLFEATLRQQKPNTEAISGSFQITETIVKDDLEEVPAEVDDPNENSPEPEAPLDVAKQEKDQVKPTKLKKFDPKLWQDVLNSIKVKYNTLYGIIRMAEPSFNGDALVLKTKFEFHKRLLSDTKNQEIILKVIKDLTGKTVTISVSVDKDMELDNFDEKTKELVEISQSITTINNIFGGAEVVE